MTTLLFSFILVLPFDMEKFIQRLIKRNPWNPKITLRQAIPLSIPMLIKTEARRLDIFIWSVRRQVYKHRTRLCRANNKSVNAPIKLRSSLRAYLIWSIKRSRALLESFDSKSNRKRETSINSQDSLQDLSIGKSKNSFFPWQWQTSEAATFFWSRSLITTRKFLIYDSVGSFVVESNTRRW